MGLPDILMGVSPIIYFFNLNIRLNIQIYHFFIIMVTYNIFQLQEKYRLDPKRILELIKEYNATIIGDNLSLDKLRVKQFNRFLDLTLKANQLCQDANTLLSKRLYYDSLLKYEKAKKIAEELGDLSTTVTCHNNIGLILEILKDFSNSLMNFEQALQISKKLCDQLGVALQLGNIGRIYKNEKKYDKALSSFKESFEILSRIELESSLHYIKEEVKSYIKEIEESIKSEWLRKQ